MERVHVTKKNIVSKSFLAPTGAQGVTLSVRLSVQDKFV